MLQSITEYYRILQSISSASTWTNFWACFSKIPQDFELLKQVLESSHQTSYFGQNQYIGTLILSLSAFPRIVRRIDHQWLATIKTQCFHQVQWLTLQKPLPFHITLAKMVAYHHFTSFLRLPMMTWLR